jgi:hypothetical protein
MYFPKVSEYNELKLHKKGIPRIVSQYTEDTFDIIDKEISANYLDSPTFEEYFCKEQIEAYKLLDERSRHINRWWFENNQPTLFVESGELCDILINSKFNLRMEDLPSGKEFFEEWSSLWTEPIAISVPENYTINGVKIQPFLFWLYPSMGDELQTSNDSSLFITWSLGMFMKSCSVLIGLDKFITNKPNYPILEDEEDVNDDYNPISPNLTEDEKKRNISIKLAISAWLYMRSCPDKVVHDFPETMKIQPNMGVKKEGVILLKSPEFIRDSSGKRAHWRNPHFAKLVHPRYHGGKEGCSKIIFRCGGVVGRIDPSTLIK